MGSRGGSNGGGAGVQPIPAASRKMIQSLKEIVNCPEAEIYAMLKECNMDPNEAVNRLLSQDPFHEVKSKREKKKENKDPTESRSRGSRGGRGGTDRYDGRGGSTQFNYSESGALHGKPAHKKENGTFNHTSSSSVSGMAGNNMHRRPLAQSDLVTSEYKATTIGTGDGCLSSLQTSSGYQPTWSGVPGQVSMADIVKMGRPQGKASSTTNPSKYGVNHHIVEESESNEAHRYLFSSEDYVSNGTDQHVSQNEEWPTVERPPAASVHPPVLEAPVASELHADSSVLSSDRINQHPESDRDEFQAVEGADIGNVDANQAKSASVSSRRILEENSGGASLFNSDIYKNMGSYQPQINSFDCQEVDNGVSVSSVTSNLQQLSVEGDGGPPPEEDKPSVIIPSHLQVQSADCSHLSFGSFGSGVSAAFPGPFSSRHLRTNMNEASVDEDALSTGHPDTRNPEYYGDDSLKTASDGNLVDRTGTNTGSYDLPSSSQSDMLTPKNSEPPQENQYMFPSSSSNYDFEKGQQLNASFPHSKTMPQMQNLAPFSSSTYTNSLPSSLLAASVQPVRKSDLPYSPFPMTQSMTTKYGSTVSSISASTISMAEALKTAGFSSTQQTAQNLPGSSIAAGPALPQHLAMHPYSQPTLPLGPFANMIGYPFLPQSYTYMPSTYQQAFAGNNTYHQSLAAALPHYKNSVSVSSLPQSTASGYGGFGNSTGGTPGNFPMNPPSAQGSTTIGYEDIMSAQYKDTNHLISLQQNENSGMWVHGPGSRTISAVPGSTYYSFQGHNQQPSGYRQSQQPSENYGAHGYPNFYHSLDHQQQNPRDGLLGGSQGQPSKQSQQLWQNSY